MRSSYRTSRTDGLINRRYKKEQRARNCGTTYIVASEKEMKIERKRQKRRLAK